MADASVKDSDFLYFLSHKTDILSQLGLTEYFPNKLSILDFRRHDYLKLDHNMSNVKWILIRNLIGLNAKARDKELEPFLKTDENVSISIDSTEVNTFVSSLMARQFSSGANSKVKFHPSDILLAIFCCCEPMLKQLIVSKMFNCRLAVPLISLKGVFVENSVMWSWPLHGIMIEASSGVNKPIQESLIKTKLKVVSFIRIGRPSVSKSKLLNEILSNHYHDTFFNRDSPLGTSTRSLSNGLIEASWFLPGRHEHDIFSDVIMFLNLRGEGIEFESQCKILRKISNILVLIVEFKQLNEHVTIDICTRMHESNMFVVYALDCNGVKENYVEKTLTSFLEKIRSICKKFNVIIIVNEKGSDTIKTELRQMVNLILPKEEALSIKDVIQTLSGIGVVSDENDLHCSTGKEKADCVMTSVKNKPKKDVMLLHESIFIEITTLLKQQRKTSEAKNMKVNDQLEMRLKELRKLQHLQCDNLSDPVKIFISTLNELKDRNESLQFFLSYLKIEMDEMSRNNRRDLRLIYNKKWDALQLHTSTTNQKKLEALKQDVDKAKHNLEDALFGYEHFIREIGQMYECTQDIGPLLDLNLMSFIEKCPRMVATQLLLGQPFEIMDGDAANVPTKWVNAIFRELVVMIGDVKVLSISVLGIQSSGKSTLLNTMFGLQFAVSAGKCTRGVFLQLLPLPSGVYPFEYLLVIDTEGLRAPEMIPNIRDKHDNELATLVVGLGDITVINVKGENTAEISNVLQIVVHSFLRLKLTKKNNISLHQSCIFVHQNVPAENAEDQLQLDRKNFEDSLDKMTKEAAELEHMQQYSSFNKVMDFNRDGHVFYFSDLWYGDPPMAHVNQGYSLRSQKLKTFLFSEIIKKRNTFLTLSATRQRIIDLWEGILTDDFVFSFRNSIELKAYNWIEKFFQSLKFDLEKLVFEFVHNEAENMFASCQTKDECEHIYKKTTASLKKQINEKLLELENSWRDHLDKSEWLDLVINWKEAKVNSLKEFALAQENEGLMDLKSIKDEYILTILNQQALSQSDTRMWFTKAQTFADKLKGKRPSNDELQREFNTMWSSIRQDLKLQRKSNDKNRTIGEQLEEELKSWNHAEYYLLHEISKKPLKYNYEKLKQLKGSIQENDIKHLDTKDYKNLIRIGDNVLEKVDIFFNKKRKSNLKFNIHFFKEILKIIDDELNDLKTQRAITLPKMFKAILQTHIRKYAEHEFMSMNKTYEEVNGCLRKLNDYKTTLWNFFKARAEERSEELSATNAFCKIIEEAVNTSVSTVLPMDIQNQILEDFAYTKYNLMVKILDSLAVKENFEEFKSYIAQPETFAQRWIKSYTEAKIFSTVDTNKYTKYAMLAKRRIDKIFESILAAIEFANHEQSESKIEKWIEIFIKSMNHSLPISSGKLVLVKERNIPDITSFTKLLVSELPKLQEECLVPFANVTPTNVMWVGINPYKSIASTLWGCKACCPFCSEPCQKTDNSHFEKNNADFHSCIQHRPAGVSGMHDCKSLKFTIEVCNYKVQCDNFFKCSASHYECRKWEECFYTDDETTSHHLWREYKHYIPSWEIAPSTSIHSSDFWSWFTAKYVGQLCQIYGVKPPEYIPESWKNITKAQARLSLGKAMM